MTQYLVKELMFGRRVDIWIIVGAVNVVGASLGFLSISDPRWGMRLSVGHVRS